jgi:hypothetical protein
MNEVRKAIKKALLDRNLTPRTVADAVGIKVESFYNIIRGGPCSDRLKRSVTDLLQATIWPGLDPAEQRRVSIRAGTRLRFCIPSLAYDFSAVGNSNITRLRGRNVTFLKDSLLVFTFPIDSSAAGAKPYSGKIEIWPPKPMPCAASQATSKKRNDRILAGRNQKPTREVVSRHSRRARVNPRSRKRKSAWPKLSTGITSIRAIPS